MITKRKVLLIGLVLLIALIAIGFMKLSFWYLQQSINVLMSNEVVKKYEEGVVEGTANTFYRPGKKVLIKCTSNSADCYAYLPSALESGTKVWIRPTTFDTKKATFVGLKGYEREQMRLEQYFLIIYWIPIGGLCYLAIFIYASISED